MTTFALVDCNNFYASCERVFNPQLEGKAIIVLSNNDGCVIARSNEAKKLNIPMGAPFFKWQYACEKKNIYAFSSNYALYGDMSHRVMQSLRYFCPTLEVYSIDEAFLLLDEFNSDDILSYGCLIKQKIQLWIGLPVSIGIASTKTLAKIANYIAKKNTQTGVFDLRDSNICEEVLSQFPIEKVWGIGRKLTKKLIHLDIKTAKQLRDSDPKMIRSHFSVVVEKIVQELRGVSCIDLETLQPKKQIMSSKSFGYPVKKLYEMQEAISHYAANACIKLRKQKSLTNGIYVFIETNNFNETDLQYSNSSTCYFSEPTCDSRVIINAANLCLKKVYRPGYSYKKAGIMLLDLSSQANKQYDLFSSTKNSNNLTMETMDLINKKWGKNSIFIGAEGTKRLWQAKAGRRSPRYTTNWDELLKVT